MSWKREGCQWKARKILALILITVHKPHARLLPRNLEILKGHCKTDFFFLYYYYYEFSA